MADQYLYPLKGARSRGLVLVTGIIAPQGTSQPVVTADGRSFTAARGGGAGLYTVTFSKRYVSARKPAIIVGGGLPNVIRMGTFTSASGTAPNQVSTWTFTIKA